MKLSMLTSLRAKLKPLLMNTSKKVVATEVAQVQALNPLSNAQDLKTGLHAMEVTPGTEVMVIMVDTDEVEEAAAAAAVGPTNGLVVAVHIMEEEEVATVVVVEEDIMIDEIIKVEEEV